MVVFHAGIFSLKDTRTLVNNMHFNDKRLMHQANLSRDLVREIQDALRDLMNKKTLAAKKEKLKIKLTDFLKKLEYFSILEEKEEVLVAREAAELEKRAMMDMRTHISGEIRKLLASHSIPRSYKDAILKKVAEDMVDIRGDITKQAEISLEVKRGSVSATLATLKIIAPSKRAASRRGKISAYHANKELDIIDDIKDKLKIDENEHAIDKVKTDLIKEAHDDETEIHYVYANVLYALLFMSYMENEFKKLGAVMNRGRRNPDVKLFITELEKKLERIKAEWTEYMTKLTRVLQQLRFSVAPTQEAQINMAA